MDTGYSVGKSVSWVTIRKSANAPDTSCFRFEFAPMLRAYRCIQSGESRVLFGGIKGFLGEWNLAKLKSDTVFTASLESAHPEWWISNCRTGVRGQI
jgi:hypothetical protein